MKKKKIIVFSFSNCIRATVKKNMSNMVMNMCGCGIESAFSITGCSNIKGINEH